MQHTCTYIKVLCCNKLCCYNDNYWLTWLNNWLSDNNGIRWFEYLVEGRWSSHCHWECRGGLSKEGRVPVCHMIQLGLVCAWHGSERRWCDASPSKESQSAITCNYINSTLMIIFYRGHGRSDEQNMGTGWVSQTYARSKKNQGELINFWDGNVQH